MKIGSENIVTENLIVDVVYLNQNELIEVYLDLVEWRVELPPIC
jgi:hypothetical protein